MDVPIETQTNAALAILQAIYSLLPAGVRPLVGYNTFFMGDINNELYHPNIQLYFVPRHILNSSKRIYGKKINVDIIYAVESKYFDKINQDTFAFQRIWQVVPDTLSDFYDLFDTVIGDEAVNRYGYLGCLEQLSPVSHSNDCKHEEVVENILSRLVFISTWVDAHGIYEIKSAHIAKLLHDYSYLSNLFSEVEGTTIEKYFIAQKIEKVKELLVYDELSLSEIAFQMNYSSVGYLSNQFKKVTGLTPSYFKNIKENKRKPLDEV